VKQVKLEKGWFFVGGSAANPGIERRMEAFEEFHPGQLYKIEITL
jgi:hypothetical protein